VGGSSFITATTPFSDAYVSRPALIAAIGQRVGGVFLNKMYIYCYGLEGASSGER
jgi:hypothetical protein